MTSPASGSARDSFPMSSRLVDTRTIFVASSGQNWILIKTKNNTRQLFMTTHEWNANVIQLKTIKSLSIPFGLAKMIHSIGWGWSCGIVARNCFPGSLSQAGLIWSLSFLFGTWLVVRNIAALFWPMALAAFQTTVCLATWCELMSTVVHSSVKLLLLPLMRWCVCAAALLLTCGWPACKPSSGL